MQAFQFRFLRLKSVVARFKPTFESCTSDRRHGWVKKKKKKLAKSSTWLVLGKDRTDINLAPRIGQEVIMGCIYEYGKGSDAGGSLRNLAPFYLDFVGLHGVQLSFIWSFGHLNSLHTAVK